MFQSQAQGNNFNFVFENNNSIDFTSNLRTTIKFNRKLFDSPTSSPENPPSTQEKTKMKNSFTLEPKEISHTPSSNVCRKLNFDGSDGSLSMLKRGSIESISSNDGSFYLIRRKSSTNFGLKHPKFDEDYVIMRTLSVGEQGTVYLCLKVKDKVGYAVKLTKEFTNKKDYQNMLNFVMALNDGVALATNGFILNYSDFWIEDDIDDSDINLNYYKAPKVLYIVTNYCSNGNLIDYLNKLKQLNFVFDSNFFYDIIFEMLCAVMHIHKIGYVHFDIKPKNFLIDAHGHIKLTDFCLSKNQSFVELNQKDLPDGDAIYLSPELFHKTNVSFKTDIFSLGLSILEILTNESLPKNGEIWRAIRSSSIPSCYYDKINSNLDRDLYKTMISSMTVVNPLERCSIEEILTDKEKYPMFYKRYQDLENGEYKNVFDPFERREFKDEQCDFSTFNVEDINKNFVKRSDSTKFAFSNNK